MLSDILGSTVALADSSGTPATEYTYDPFGASTATGSSTSNAYDFTGREDDLPGLKYYRARYYNPGRQRFVSEDPIGFSDGDTNLYGCVLNNPLSYVDPLGLGWQLVVGVTALAGGSPFLVGGLFGGGGANLIFTSSGQVGLQFTATGSAGVGLYAGVGIQAGGGYSKCPTPGGISVNRVGQFDANAGWGTPSVGVSAQYDLAAGGVQLQKGVGRLGIGYGVQASVGIAQIVTIATRPMFAPKPKSGCP